jgi:hypothetical protein
MRGRSWGLGVMTVARRADTPPGRAGRLSAAFHRVTGLFRKMLSGETRLPGFPSNGWERAPARVPGRRIAPGGSATM